MPAFTFFDEFKKFLGDGTIDLDTHTFKVALSNTAPNAGTNTVFADITEIAAGNGYLAGGGTLTSVTWAETGAGTGIFRWGAADFSWTASGGSIGPWRYFPVYDDTHASKPLVGYVDYGSSNTTLNGNSVTFDVGATGIFDLQ
jgi:hypothetical protein